MFKPLLKEAITADWCGDSKAIAPTRRVAPVCRRIHIPRDSRIGDVRIHRWAKAIYVRRSMRPGFACDVAGNGQNRNDESTPKREYRKQHRGGPPNPLTRLPRLLARHELVRHRNRPQQVRHALDAAEGADSLVQHRQQRQNGPDRA